MDRPTLVLKLKQMIGIEMTEGKKYTHPGSIEVHYVRERVLWEVLKWVEALPLPEYKTYTWKYPTGTRDNLFYSVTAVGASVEDARKLCLQEVRDRIKTRTDNGMIRIPEHLALMSHVADDNPDFSISSGPRFGLWDDAPQEVE